MLSPCGTRRLRHPSKEVKFIFHKSHVKCLRGEVIKQMYEARGKVHPFQKTLPVSAALQKSQEAEGSNRHGSSFPDRLLFISSSIYLMAFSLLEELPELCCPLSQLPSVGAVRGEGGGWHIKQLGRDGVMDGGCPVINNQTKSFYWASCGKCGFGNICLHPTNNKWCFFPFLCFSPPAFPPSLSLFLLCLPRITD